MAAAMIELTRTEDAVLVSWLEIRLAEAGIKAYVLDGYTSSAYGGALSGVQRRVMVEEADFERSKQVLAAAGHVE